MPVELSEGHPHSEAFPSVLSFLAVSGAEISEPRRKVVQFPVRTVAVASPEILGPLRYCHQSEPCSAAHSCGSVIIMPSRSCRHGWARSSTQVKVRLKIFANQ